MIAELNPSTKDKPLKGDFTITGLDLNIFQPFIAQLEQLTGKINGFANNSGTLSKPYITGKIKLIDGNMSGDIPTSLEKVPIAAAIEGESLKVNGDWHSGSNGYGTVTGIIAWSKELDVNLSMQTDKLPVIVAPYA